MSALTATTTTFRKYLTAPSFDDKTYDPILEFIYSLFDVYSIQVDVGAWKVVIDHPGVYLTLSFSANETKVSISGIPMPIDFETNAAARNLYLKHCYRLFSMDDLKVYLKTKNEEATWIINHQG